MQSPGAPATILVVNDVPDQLALASAVLRQAGYHVIEAPDGREGFMLARSAHPALIVSDVVMPYGDGIELCRQVRADETLALVPILLVSAARKDAASVIEALAAGADELLAAPYEPLRLVAHVTRLLERARHAELLRRSEARYRTLIDNANDIIYTLDLDGRYVSLNKAGERLTGYTREEVRRLRWRDVVAPEYADLTQQMIERKLAGAEAITIYEIEIVDKHGRRVPLEVSTQLIHEDNRPTGLLGIARDITERRRAEAERRALFSQQAETEKMRSLGQLSAGVAHNFNNALAAILGRTQLLLRAVTDERHRRSLQVIETAALDAAEIVRRIQTFARRTPAVAATIISLAQLVTDALQLTRTRWEDDAHARGLHYDVCFTPGIEGHDRVEANATELREVFVNLIFNALDAMPAGGQLDLREYRTGDWLVVEVADTGPGIPAELQARIFEPFFTTKGPQGSGLGLAVSYGTIKRLGGDIEVASTPGAGTTFTLRLPARRAPAPPHARAHTGPVPARRVLVVEDEAQVRAVLCEILEALGQQVTPTASAAEALGALAHTSFDLLITDLSMPDTDGLTLAAHARARLPHLPVALVTGYGQLDPAAPLAGNLIQAVINKPFRLAEVEAVLRDLCAPAR